jgi:hypothetical protein
MKQTLFMMVIVNTLIISTLSSCNKNDSLSDPVITPQPSHYFEPDGLSLANGSGWHYGKCICQRYSSVSASISKRLPGNK